MSGAHTVSCSRTGAPRRRTGTTARDRRTAERGQAAVELVALLPLVVAVVLGVVQALAAGLAQELAAHAAHAGAVAVAEGRDGTAAAQAALPGWARSRLRVDVRGSTVRVHVTPPALLPGIAQRLAADASADAGPQP